jgi:hypothetical protein
MVKMVLPKQNSAIGLMVFETKNIPGNAKKVLPVKR